MVSPGVVSCPDRTSHGEDDPGDGILLGGASVSGAARYSAQRIILEDEAYPILNAFFL